MVEELYRKNERLLEIFFSHPDSKTGLVEAVFRISKQACAGIYQYKDEIHSHLQLSTR